MWFLLCLSISGLASATHREDAALTPFKDVSCTLFGGEIYDAIDFESVSGIFSALEAESCSLKGKKDDCDGKFDKSGTPCNWVADECQEQSCAMKKDRSGAEVKLDCTAKKGEKGVACSWWEPPTAGSSAGQTAECVAPDKKASNDATEVRMKAYLENPPATCASLAATADACNGKKEGDDFCYLAGTCKSDMIWGDTGCGVVTDPVQTSTTCGTLAFKNCEWDATGEKCIGKRGTCDPQTALEEAGCKALKVCKWDTTCQEADSCFSHTTSALCTDKQDSDGKLCKWEVKATTVPAKTFAGKCKAVEACNLKCYTDKTGYGEGFACTTGSATDAECSTCALSAEDSASYPGKTRPEMIAEKMKGNTATCETFTAKFPDALKYIRDHQLGGVTEAEFATKVVSCQAQMKTQFDAVLKASCDGEDTAKEQTKCQNNRKEQVKYMVFSAKNEEVQKAFAHVVGMSVEDIKKHVEKEFAKLKEKTDPAGEAEVSGAVAMSITSATGALMFFAAFQV